MQSIEQPQTRQPRSLDPRLANGVLAPQERGEYGAPSIPVPQGLLTDLFAESREWRAEVKECRIEVGRVREAANTGTFLTGSGAGVVATLLVVVLGYLILKK